MNDVCKNCKFGKSLDMNFIDMSLKAQSDMKKAKTKVAGKGKKARLEAIEKVVTSEAYQEHIKSHGAFSMTKKATDIDGAYISCSNLDSLADEKAKKPGIVHKYYFSCPHFEGK